MINKNIDRKDFIRFMIKGAGVVAFGPLLNACENSLYHYLEVDEDLCIGCGNCLKVCYYNAIQLPEKTSYTILSLECNKCMLCVPVCKPGAIEIDTNGFPYIIEELCNRCGECYNVCEILAVDRDLKSASIDLNNCHRCDKCTRICPRDAIGQQK